MDQVVISAQKRANTGSRNCARLRKQGRVPAVVYGRAGTALSLDLDAIAFAKAVRNISESTIIKLDVEGTGRDAFVKHAEYDILSGKVVHVDFYEVESDKLLRARVSLHLVGSAVGVRDGGILENPMHEIEVECFPRFLPEKIDVNVGDLKANQSIHVRDLQLGGDIRIISPADQVIALVKYAKAEVEEAPAAAVAAAAVPGAAVAPGAATPAAAAPAAAAPAAPAGKAKA